MRNYFNKRIFAFITVFFILLATGCGEKDTQSGAGSSDYAQSGQNDLADPENKDYKTESGAEVDAEELEVKKGKANGIDVSKWQGLIDWKAVKSDGIDFAIIRIGFRGENGEIYKDDCADYNIQQAHKAGVLVGIYFFSTAMTTAEAKEEAEWTVSAIEGYPISYPVVYDCEGFLNPESRVYGISNKQRTDNAVTFLEYVEAEGYEGMFYAAKSELENSAYWDTERIEKDFMVWVARYPDRPYPNTAAPDYSGKYSMWQYTDKGAVRGIKGNLTLKYGKQFEGLEEQTNMLSNSRYYKVLSYSKSKAKVFYVSDTGDVITFIKAKDVWEIEEWKTVWSKSGSADSFYWPYYR